jgi:hypothetical protein
MFTAIHLFAIPFNILSQSLRQLRTGISSFEKAIMKIGIDQKTVLKKYKKSEKIPRTGPGRNFSIVL